MNKDDFPFYEVLEEAQKEALGLRTLIVKIKQRLEENGENPSMNPSIVIEILDIYKDMGLIKW